MMIADRVDWMWDKHPVLLVGTIALALISGGVVLPILIWWLAIDEDDNAKAVETKP